MAATQRPVTEAALAERAVDPAWKRLPSYVIYGSGRSEHSCRHHEVHGGTGEGPTDRRRSTAPLTP